MWYVIGGLVFLFGGLITFFVASVIVYFVKWPIVSFAIGGAVGLLLRIVFHLITKDTEVTSYPSSSQSPSVFLSDRETERHISSSSPISSRRR